MKKFEVKAASIIKSFLLLLVATVFVNGQSTNVNFPTPVTSSSISGNIKARDIGDSRLTSHYYVFEGRQGDIFLKIESNNLDGDIDIYYADGLRPITKIKLYSDSSPTETGREIYLRKPEKLILRIEGRTPNDDSATYSIKFTGSFQTVAGNPSVEEPKTPEVKTSTDSDVRVNSVGTIIERKPTPTPQPKPQTSAKTEPVTRNREVSKTNAPQPDSTVKPKTTVKKEVEESPEKPETVAKTTPSKSDTTAKTPASKNTKSTTSGRNTTTAARKPAPTIKKETPKVEPKPDPAAELASAMENVKLVVEFKDGKKIERPMNDVLRFGVDKGILTIINKNGAISRHSIIEITKITVE